MSVLLVDTSVLVKWFDVSGEADVSAARSLRDAHIADVHPVRLLDLAIYELSNVLLRRRRWPAEAVGDAIDDLASVVGGLIPVSTTWARDAFRLAEQHGLSSYDACWAAAARHLGVSLVSADRQLLEAGLAESPSQAVQRLGLS